MIEFASGAKTAPANFVETAIRRRSLPPDGRGGLRYDRHRPEPGPTAALARSDRAPMASADQPSNSYGHLGVKKLTADILVRRYQHLRLFSPVWVGPSPRAMAANDLVNVFLDRAFPSGLDPRMAQLVEDLVYLMAVEKPAEPLGNLMADL